MKGLRFLLIGLALVLSGCGRSQEMGVAPPEQPVAPLATQVGPVIGDTTEGGGLALTVNEVTALDSGQSQREPQAGRVFIVADVTLENVGDATLPYTQFDSVATDERGFTYESLALPPEPALGSGELAPGQSVRGNLAFEVPRGQALKLIWTSPSLQGDILEVLIGIFP